MSSQATGGNRPQSSEVHPRAVPPTSRRAALRDAHTTHSQPREQPLFTREGLLHNKFSWLLLSLVVVCIAALLFRWLHTDTSDHVPRTEAMRITAADFPAQYNAQEDISLSAIAFPHNRLPNTRYEPAQCATFASQKPFEDLSSGKATLGVQHLPTELRSLVFGVVNGQVPWNKFQQFTELCPRFTMSNNFGTGTINIRSTAPPDSGAPESVSYFLETRSNRESLAKHSFMWIVLAHVADRTVFAGLTVQSLNPLSEENVADRELFLRLYSTLVQRVLDNS